MMEGLGRRIYGGENLGWLCKGMRSKYLDTFLLANSGSPLK